MLPRALLRADKGAHAHRRARERRRSDEARRESRRAASHYSDDRPQAVQPVRRTMFPTRRPDLPGAMGARVRWTCEPAGDCAMQRECGRWESARTFEKEHEHSTRDRTAHHLSERNIPRRCSAVCTPLTLRGGGYRAGGLKWPTRAPRFLVRSMKGSSSLSDLTMFSTVFNIVQRAAAHGPAHHSGSRRNSCARWEAWW